MSNELQDYIDQSSVQSGQNTVARIQALIAADEQHKQKDQQPPLGAGEGEAPKTSQGAVGTGVQQFTENLAPNTAGLAGGVVASRIAGAGLAAAATAALPAEMASGPIGWALAGLTQVGVFMAGQAAAEGVAKLGQEAVQKGVMGEEQFNAYKQDLAANAKAHPIAAMAGNFATQMPFMGFSAKNVGEAVKTAKEMAALKDSAAFAEWMKDANNVKKAGDLMGVALGAGVGGVQDATGQIASGKDFDLLEFGGNMAFGAFMNKPTALTEYIGAKVGGPLGELLSRNLTATEAQKAAYEKAGLTQQMQDAYNNLATALANGEIKSKADLELAQRQAADTLRAAEAAAYLDQHERQQVEKLAEQKAYGQMYDAQINDVEQMRQQDLLRLQQRTSDTDTALRGMAKQGEYGDSNINSGIVAANKEYAPSNQPSYTWGQDIARDQKKIDIAKDVSSLRNKLDEAIKSNKSAYYKQQLADKLDQRIRDYHDIQSQSWDERMSDQQIPIIADKKATEERLALATYQRQYGLQDKRASINNAADSMVAELLARQDHHARAEAQLQLPGVKERLAYQLVAKDNKNPIAQRLLDYTRREQLKEQFRAKRSQDIQSQQVSPEAKAAVDESITAFKEFSARGRANGNVKEADAIDAQLAKIEAEPDVQKKIAMLQQIDPKHPQVRALTEASDDHNLLGSFEESKLPQTTPEQASATAIDTDKSIQFTKRAFDDKTALRKVSDEAVFMGQKLEKSLANDWHNASKAVGEAETNIFKAGAKAVRPDGTKIGGDALHTMAKEYTHVLSDIDKGNLHGFGKDGIETLEQLQARIDAIRKESGNGFKQIEAYQKTIARLSQENLKRAFEIGKIDKQTYDLLSTKYKNYVSSAKELSEAESLGQRLRGGSGNGQPIQKFESAAPIGQRLNPSESVLSQRAQVNVNARNFAVIRQIMKEAGEGKMASKIFSFSNELKPGWTTGGNTMKYTLANGEALYVHSNSIEVAKAMNLLDREQLPEALKMLGKATNFIAQMAVHKNPGFWGAGLAYDLWGSLQNIASTPIAKMRVEFIKNWVKQFPGSLQSNLQVAGQKGDYWTNRALEAGALDRGWFMQGAKKTAADITRTAKIDAEGGLPMMMRNVWNEIGNVNDALFAMPRVAAYRTAIEGGLSEAQAVRAAHDIGPNYANKGTYVSAVGQYKAFAGASMAGTERIIRSFYNKEGKFDQGKFLTFVAGSLAANMLIRSRNDSVDKYWRDKWDGDKNWVFAIDRTHAITIPMEFAQRPIHMLTGLMSDASNGRGDITTDDLTKIAASMTEAYTPFGSKNVVSAFAPTVLEGPIDIATNTSYAGKPIIGRGLEERVHQGLPAHLAFYNTFGKNLMEQAGIKTTDALAAAGFDKLTPQQATYELNSIFGGVRSITTGNFGQSRFYKTLDEDRAKEIEQAAEAAPFNEQMAKVKEQIAIKRFDESQRVNEMAKEIFKMPLDEQKQAVYALAERDQDMAHEVTMKLGALARAYIPKVAKSK